MHYVVNAILALGALGIVGYVIGISVYKYRTTPGTALLTAFHDSLVILWSRVLALMSALLGLAMYLPDLLGDPSVSSAVQNALPPKLVPLVLVAVAIITNLLRRHTLPPDQAK